MSNPADDDRTLKRNQFGEYVEDVRRMEVPDWELRWQQGKTRFHVPKVHPTLQQYYSLLMGDATTPLRIVMPLCGKSLDLKWLADKGHTVVGIECVEMAIEEFYQMHALDFTREPLPSNVGGYKYMSTDPNCDITIYCCDFFKLSRDVMSLVDCIWDRGSFAALDDEDRERYAPVITQFMHPDTRYLLCTFNFDSSRFAGPPYPTNTQFITKLYGDRCDIDLLGERNTMTDWQSKEWGLDWFTEQTHLLTLKRLLSHV